MHLAQLNIARMLAPDIGHPLMADFVAQLDTINQLAERSDGFVWRLTGEGNDATDLRPFDDERVIVNLSVWASFGQLSAFVFRSAHTEVMKNRRQWFEKPAQPTTVLWWIPVGHLPTLAEAQHRLEHLHSHGPGPLAFTFRDVWPPAPDPVTNMPALPSGSV